MHKKFGFSHWYPFMDLETFKRSLEGKKLYGVYQHDLIIATFNLSPSPRNYYYDELWSNPCAKALYLGQLAITPEYQKQGIGKWCMMQIEKLTLDFGSKVVRFDALNEHPWLKRFYEKLGYCICGIVKPNRWELVCFEKYLN